MLGTARAQARHPEPPLVLAAEARGEDRRGIVEVLVEVSDGTIRSRLRVRAGSIERALERAGDYGEARVLFPIEPDPFFVGSPSLAVRV